MTPLLVIAALGNGWYWPDIPLWSDEAFKVIHRGNGAGLGWRFNTGDHYLHGKGVGCGAQYANIQGNGDGSGEI